MAKSRSIARKRLVDDGVIDNSEHGVWKLKRRTSPSWWVEKSLVTGRLDRETGDNALGKSLWSPIRSQDGRDIYRNMRFVQPGDHIIHLVDNQRIAGVSTSESFARPDFIGLQNTDWAGILSYRIQLRDYAPLSVPIERDPALIERVAELAAQRPRLSLRAIAGALAADDVLSAANKPYTAAAIARMLPASDRRRAA